MHPNVFRRTKDPNWSIFQKADDEGIRPNPPFRNVFEIHKVVQAKSLAGYNNGIRAKFRASANTSLG
jgi:hypothetical protein